MYKTDDSRPELPEDVKCSRRSKYSLTDLLENTQYPLSASEREWIDAPAVGREVV